MPGDEDPIPEFHLADAVELVRSELSRARRAADDDGIRFNVASVEMEFAGEIRRDVQTKGEVRFWVFTGGGSVGGARSAGHRVKVTLDAVDAMSGERIQINESAGGNASRPAAAD